MIKQILFPIHTLSNHDILRYANLIRMPLDCVAKDNMPMRLKNNTAIVVNLQNSYERGSHWVCAVNKNNKCLYYDSFGIEFMPKNIEKCLINSVGRENVFISNEHNQKLLSILCGYFCLWICKSVLLDGMSFEGALDKLTDTPSNKNDDTADNLYI